MAFNRVSLGLLWNHSSILFLRTIVGIFLRVGWEKANSVFLIWDLKWLAFAVLGQT